MESILAPIFTFAANTVSTFGYPGIFFLMALESAFIPIPSEVTMSFSGYLASQGRFSLSGIILAGTLGSIFGAWISYIIGHFLKKRVIRKLISRYGKFILLTEEEYDKTVNLFKKYGYFAVLIGRLIPGIRAVISLPAGVASLNFYKFTLLTFIGSLIWVSAVSLTSFKLGENWRSAYPFFSKFDTVIFAAVIILITAYMFKKFKKNSNDGQK